ncbi:hypothetical protein M5D96_011952, partial [Drosophila gunungcola]
QTQRREISIKSQKIESEFFSAVSPALILSGLRSSWYRVWVRNLNLDRDRSRSRKGAKSTLTDLQHQLKIVLTHRKVAPSGQ